MPGIDQNHLQVALKDVVDRTPVDSRTLLRRCNWALMSDQSIPQLYQVIGESAEFLYYFHSPLFHNGEAYFGETKTVEHMGAKCFLLVSFDGGKLRISNHDKIWAAENAGGFSVCGLPSAVNERF